MVPNYLSYRIFHNIDAFGIGMTNPLDAHNGYETDEHVIALIANGAGNKDTSPIIKERCTTMITTD